MDATRTHHAKGRSVPEAEAFRAAFEACGVGLCLLDTELRVLHANEAALSFLGAPREAAGRSLWDLFPDVPLHQRELVSGAVRGGPIDFPLYQRAVKGEERWYAGRVVPMALEDGPLFVLTLSDVTEHEHTEARLQEERRYRSLFENTPYAVYVTKHDGTVLDANRAACQLHGMTVGEIRERGRSGVVLPDGRLSAGLKERLGSGQFKGELTFLRKDGSTVPVEVESVLVDPDRADFTTFVIAHDITQRKKVEEELGRLAAAVDQTPASIVITDPAGVIQYVNPAFERITQYSRSEALGRRPNVLKSGKHDDSFYRELWETIREGKVWKGRLINKAKDGRMFTEDAVIAPVLDDQGTIRNYVAVKRDITEELALQESLLQTQRLETVGRLAGGVAHDFNNILTVILSCGEALLGATRRGEHVSEEDVEQINQAAGRASDLTRQLLAFARRQVMAPEAMDLNQVVGRSLRMLERLVGEDIDLRAALGPDLWPVRSDPAQVEQILLNLVTNARDALPRGGTVEIRTDNLAIAGGDPVWPRLTPGHYVQLAVTDDGVGMAPEVMVHAFEPFFTTKSLGRGTGLGLATVHGIVAQGGGDIRVESRPGEGTRLVVALPRSEATVADPEQAAEPVPVRGGKETILLVEDEATVRKHVLRALAGAGYEVHIAGDGKEALELAESFERAPDLLLSDVVMPRLDGPRLAEALKLRWPKIRVLLMSGYTDDRLEPTGVLGSGAELIQKPFTGSALLRRVRAMLDRPMAT